MSAQVSSSTGAIQGTVQDASGAVIPGATATLTNATLAVNRQTKTQADGTYSFPFVQPTTGYQVSVEANGFQRVVLPDLIVRLTEITVANAKLPVGSATEQVVVTGDAQVVQTTSATLGAVVTSQVVTALPLPTRNVFDLLATDAGVGATLTSPSSTILQGSQALFVGGSRATANNYMLNGVDANNFEFHTLAAGIVPVPDPDAVQEFRTQTSLYDATTGFSAGGNINLITRSGSSQFHGAAYEFLRNGVLNANDFFFNRNGIQKPFLQQNQFGGSFGGPVPKLKDTFFFVNYEGQRQKNGVSGSVTGFLPVIPATRSAATLASAFGLPVAAIDPVAVKYLNAPGPYGGLLFPSGAGANAGTLGTFVFSSPVIYNADQVSPRIDHEFNTGLGANHLSASGFYSTGSLNNFGGATGGLGQAYQYLFGNDSMAIDDTQIFRANLLNDLVFGFTWNKRDINSLKKLSLADVGMSRFNSSFVNGLPNLQFQEQLNCCGNAASVHQTQHNASFDVRDTVSWILNKHTLRLGFETRRQQFNFVAPYDRGTLAFGTGIADALYGPSPLGAAGDLSIRDFLIGAPQEIAIGTGLNVNGYRARDYIGFIQDDYRVSRRLTLNLGLRYDYLGYVTEVHNHLSNFDASLVSQSAIQFGGAGLQPGFIIANQNGVSPSTLKTDNHGSFAPRVGFAYDVFGNAKLAVRGGYGLYYQRIGGGGPLQTSSNPPYQINTDNINTTRAGILSNPFPTLPLPTQFPLYPTFATLSGLGPNGAPIYDQPLLSLSTLDRNIKTPYTQNWNLTMQGEFLPNWTAEVGYVGSHGIHLLAAQNLNNALLRNANNPARFGLITNSSANRDARVPVAGFSAAGNFAITGAGKSFYDGLLVTITHRFAKGVYFKSAYTFSKTIDTYPASTGFDIGGTPAGNQFVEDLNKGLANFDQRHRLVVTYVWELPGFKKGPLSWALGYWSVAGITTLQSGFPGTITQSIGNTSLSGANGYGLVSFGCQLVSSGAVKDKLNNYLNKACVSTTPLLAGGAPFGPLSPFASPGDQIYSITPGGSGRLSGPSTRGFFRNPFQKRWDLTASKKFPVHKLGEAANLEFRAEFFKLFNNPIFNSLTSSASAAGSPSFGRITSTIDNTGRQIQFALKLNF
ncbi:MAG: carboxypeptidase regulatory-like domain-containing protein [Bryobacteraceae bacterium]